MAINTYNPISGIKIIDLAAANGPNTGSLIAATADTLTWTPPGGTVGDAVSIAYGETQTIYGTDATKWIRVRRTSEDDLSGTALVTGDGFKGAYEQLVDVNTAIALAEEAQSAGNGDMRVQRATLDSLYKRRDRLARALARRDGRGSVYTADMRGNF